MLVVFERKLFGGVGVMLVVFERILFGGVGVMLVVFERILFGGVGVWLVVFERLPLPPALPLPMNRDSDLGDRHEEARPVGTLADAAPDLREAVRSLVVGREVALNPQTEDPPAGLAAPRLL